MARLSGDWVIVTPTDRVIPASIDQFVPLSKVPAFKECNSRSLLRPLVEQAKAWILSNPAGLFQVREMI
jgi:hypothetical protein